MELYIKDRLFIPQLLPQQGTFMEYAIKREIVNKVALTADDKNKYDIVENQEEQRIEWDIEKDIANPTVVSFTSAELDYLKKAAKLWLTSRFPMRCG